MGLTYYQMHSHYGSFNIAFILIEIQTYMFTWFVSFDPEAIIESFWYRDIGQNVKLRKDPLVQSSVKHEL